jgi:endonuclease/exonuclease/phosphatase family metal-dependent hydrolase
VLRTVIDCNNKKIGITNIHLDYESALNREIEIVEAMKLIEERMDTDYELLLGDLNCYPESSVYRYLTAQQSLNNHATDWCDMHKVYASKLGITPKATLDFFNNPRWDNENIVELSGRFDYILLKSPYPKENPKLNSVHIIGDKRELGITPSDHYGVMCDIDFSST